MRQARQAADAERAGGDGLAAPIKWAWAGGTEAGCRRPHPPLPQIRPEGKRRDGWPAGGGMGGRSVSRFFLFF
ncbi:hypothetical protein EE612_051967 [Oryza sativa]|nr:hypothetical protein EE612_051967 [Oryza sativa]